MHESLDRVTRKAGLPPGTLVHVGERYAQDSRATLVTCGPQGITELSVSSVEQMQPYQQADAVTWVHLEGLHNIPLIEAIGEQFNVHPLVLEDILNTHQRPKYEEYDDYIFIVIKSISPQKDSYGVDSKQLSILLFDNMVISFSEKSDDLFEPMKRRLSGNPARFHSLGADYLAYVLLDSVVDQYFYLQEAFDEAMESLDEVLLNLPTPDTLAKIHALKRSVIFVRRSILPLREMLVALQRSESPLIKPAAKIYFRDVYDHVMHVTEVAESTREMIADMVGVYLSSLSNRMNEIMKFLTLFAAIFIPLTFIAGIYGMNFDHMPELHYRWSYPIIWCVFIALPVSLVVFFKKKKWL